MKTAPHLGQKVRVLTTRYGCEALGVIEIIRGYGTLQCVEIRTLPGQPGAKVRVVREGQWEPIDSESEGGER